MMYNKKLVASVKCDGKIMREDGETVYLPFGKEYSILLKNLNVNRALVHIEIDGEQVVPGGLIIGANETVDLERFVVDGNMGSGPKMKFIEKTDQISEHRGDKIEDGIVRVTYQFESIAPPIYRTTYHDGFRWSGGFDGGSTVYGNNTKLDGNFKVGSNVDAQNVTRSVNFCSTAQETKNDSGITVHGDDSNQKFQYGQMGILELEQHVICLNLRGDVNGQEVQRPVTVQRRIKCDTCGTTNRSNMKFCGECGKNLTYQY